MTRNNTSILDDVIIREARPGDGKAVNDIFNRFARESFAVYSDKPLTYDFFKKNSDLAILFYVVEVRGTIVGFAYLKRFRTYDNFKHTGMPTYFLLPEYTGKGIGTRVLETFIEKGKARGVTNFVAHLSSMNKQSLNFHTKHGFSEVGRLKDMGIKFNKRFDIVWVQKQFDE